MSTQTAPSSSIPLSTARLIKKFDFNRAATQARTVDLNALSREQLIFMIEELRDTVHEYEESALQDLTAKMTLDAELSHAELHLGMPPQETGAYHQHVGLLHAYNWTEKFGHNSELLTKTNDIQSKVLRRRMGDVRHAVHAQVCPNPNEATSCKFYPALDAWHALPPAPENGDRFRNCLEPEVEQCYYGHIDRIVKEHNEQYPDGN